MIIKQGAFGVIIVLREQEYKFLILLQDEKFVNWSFPKGKAEDGETPLETALRELFEETGITDVEILDAPMLEEHYEYNKRDETYSRTNKYFIGIVKDRSLKLEEDEILDYKWATYDEAVNTFGFQKEKKIEILKKAKEYLDKI